MLGCKLKGVGLLETAPQAWGSDDPDLLGRKTFSAWTDFKFDLCSILESSSIHFGVVYEQILSIFLLNESVTLLVIEPFYATLRHTQYSYMGANPRKKNLPCRSWQNYQTVPFSLKAIGLSSLFFNRVVMEGFIVEKTLTARASHPELFAQNKLLLSVPASSSQGQSGGCRA